MTFQVDPEASPFSDYEVVAVRPGLLLLPVHAQEQIGPSVDPSAYAGPLVNYAEREPLLDPPPYVETQVDYAHVGPLVDDARVEWLVNPPPYVELTMDDVQFEPEMDPPPYSELGASDVPVHGTQVDCNDPTVIPPFPPPSYSEATRPDGLQSFLKESCV